MSETLSPEQKRPRLEEFTEHPLSAGTYDCTNLAHKNIVNNILAKEAVA